MKKQLVSNPLYYFSIMISCQNFKTSMLLVIAPSAGVTHCLTLLS